MVRMLLAMVIVVGLFVSPASKALSEIVGLWLLDEGEGEVAVDSSGNGNDGKLTGTIRWSDDGKVGGCIEGDGSIGWVEIPSSESLTRGAGPFTIMAWVKINAPGGYGIFTKSADAPVEHQDWGLWIWHGFVMFLGNWPEAPMGGQFLSQSKVVVGEWTHLAVSWGQNKLSFYINGELDAEFDWDDKFNDSEAALAIGADPGGDDEPINGLIDEVAMFDEVLSQQDIRRAMEGLETVSTVESFGKLSTMWGRIKQ